MAVTFDTVKKLDGGRVWYYEWSSSLGAGTTYYVYENAVLVDATLRNWRYVTVAEDDEVQFEVLDNPSTDPQPAYPRRGLLYWQSVDDAEYYRVEEYSGGAWTEKRRVQALSRSAYHVRTGVLTTGEHQWRVVPVTSGSIDGTPIEFAFTIVCRPDPPDVSYSYSSGTGNVTASAA